MIRHVVVFKVAGETDEDRSASLDVLAAALRPLSESVPHLRSLYVAADTSGISSHWDAVLVTEHDSWDEVTAYQSHPEHIAAVHIINPVVEDRAVVDVEF